MASKMYPFINYRDSIHYRNSCSATIVIVKFLLSLSTSRMCSEWFGLVEKAKLSNEQTEQLTVAAQAQAQFKVIDLTMDSF